MKPENIKIIAAKLKKKQEAIPAMIEKYFANPPKQNVQPTKNGGNGNGNSKDGGKNVKGQILQFIKKHWKLILMILIASCAFYFGGAALLAKFAVGPTIRMACKTIGGAKFGGAIGMAAGIAGTAAAMAMGGDADVDVDAGDVDAGDVDADVDVDAGDADADADVDAGGDDVGNGGDEGGGDASSSGVKGDLDGDGDRDGDDLAIQRGNKDWVKNLSDKDKAAISKTFNDDPQTIAANG